ncbi:MAG: hypothetical protein DRI22_01300, partial [Caldiserica bacterium]
MVNRELQMIKIVLLFTICHLPFALFSQEREVEGEKYIEGVGKLQVIRVIPGDTLHGIARIYLKDPSRWPELLEYNTIPTKDPDLILPGMKLLVPVREIKESMRAAKLIEKRNIVKYRRRGEAKWYDAVLNMELFYEDAVRTLSESKCRVRFATGEILRIGENSLIILRPEEIRQEIKLLKGEILASKARVLTESAIIEPEKKGKTIFEARIKEDRATEVNVWKGEIDVKAGGRTLRIKEGFATRIELDAPPLKPWKLPEISKEKLKEIEMELTLPPTTQLKIQKVESIGRFKPEEIDWQSIRKKVERRKNKKIVDYRVKISVNKTFTNIILDDNIQVVKKKLKNFPDGIYYVRIAPIYNDGEIGKYSKIQSFTIDRRPPKVVILKPKQGEKIEEEFISVKGKVFDKDIRVEVDGVEVIVDKDGNFQRIIFVPEGRHLIKIKIIDRNGKEFYFTREI